MEKPAADNEGSGRSLYHFSQTNLEPGASFASFSAMAQLELPQRQRALLQGGLGVFGSVAWFLLVGKVLTYVPGPTAMWHKLVFAVLLVLGLIVALLGVWRLSIGRDHRWDWRGILALCLMIFPGYPMLFMYVFMILSLFLGPMFGGK